MHPVAARRRVVAIAAAVGVLLMSAGFAVSAGTALAQTNDIDCSFGAQTVAVSQLSDLRAECEFEQVTGNCANESNSFTSSSRSVLAPEVYSSVPADAEVQVEVVEASSVQSCRTIDCSARGDTTTLSTARLLAQVCTFNTTTGNCSAGVIQFVFFDDPGPEASPDTIVPVSITQLGAGCSLTPSPTPLPDSNQAGSTAGGATNAGGATGATAVATPTATPRPTVRAATTAATAIPASPAILTAVLGVTTTRQVTAANPSATSLAVSFTG